MYTRKEAPMVMEVGLHRLIEIARDLGQIIRYDEEQDSYWIITKNRTPVSKKALSDEKLIELTPYIVYDYGTVIVFEAICCTYAKAWKDTSSLPPYEFTLTG